MEDGQERCAITFCNSSVGYCCFRCKKAYYCSENHQKLHWRSGHKVECMTPEEQQKQAAKIAKQKSDNTIQHKRKYFRKSFVNSYATSKQQDYLALASILEDAELTHIESLQTETDDDRFDYGFTVCLVIKSLYLLNHIQAAKNKMTEYIRRNQVFLNQKKYRRVQDDMTKQQQEQIFGYMQKKLELISILANLSYAVGLDHNYMYVLYAEHIAHMTRPDSIEMSNVYFFMGCNYAEQGFPNKALACFHQSAKIRVEDAQTCHFNMGILFYWLGKSNEAIIYMNKALQKRQFTYGQTSSEVAQIYQNLGMVYMSIFDFHTAQHYYSKAIQSRASNNQRTSPQYQRLKQAMETMFKKLCAYIQSEPSEYQKPQTFIALRQTMLINKKNPYDLLLSFRNIAANSAKFEVPYLWKYQFKERKNTIIFKPDVQKFYKQDSKTISMMWNYVIKEKDKKSAPKKKAHKKKLAVVQKREQFSLILSDKIMSLINATQLKLASQLQQLLSYVVNQKNAVAQIQKHPFVASLTAEQLQIFRKDNEKLYQTYLIDFPDLIQEKNKTKVSELDPALQINSKENFSINWLEIARRNIQL